MGKGRGRGKKQQKMDEMLESIFSENYVPNSHDSHL
jgi:hypothetical protein